MGISAGGKRVNYDSYLLRMWQVPTNGEFAWRISLENVQTGEKHGFANLEEFIIYLKEKNKHEDKPLVTGNHGEVEG